jgi:hypothetical protein
MLFSSQKNNSQYHTGTHLASCTLHGRLIIMCPSVPAAVICPNHIDFDQYEGIGIDL